ncbi:MAG: efflux RND transporter periplasmic adaptor subunit [Fusobacteriaceae bacterium]|uniref:efflux RND transporter periplasmic adaptor subunit n=1 Tax=Cetobacterium sp. TaxID=2071632 RepID=UPI003F2BC02C
MKNKFLIIASLLLILSCGKKEVENTAPEIKPVVFEVVKSKENSVIRTYSGTIKSEALSNLSFRVSGTISNRIAQLGDTVKKGQILATIDPIEYKLNLEKSLADSAKGNAAAAEASANFKRSEALYLENSISKASYDSAIAQYKSAASNLKALEEANNLSRLKLDYTFLKAPQSGTIGQVKSEVNQVVSPETVVFVLSSDGDTSVEFNVSQSVIGSLSQGQSVDISITSLNNKKVKGIITNIGTLSVGFGSTYPVKARITELSPDVKVGMIANVIIDTVEGIEPIISVPISSIVTGSDNEKYVYIIKDIESNVGTAQKQKVEISESPSSNGVIILSGLKDGDSIITKGSNIVKENQKVSLIKGEI